MADLPIVVTVADVKSPGLLVRLLRSLATSLANLSTKVDGLSHNIRIPSMSQVRDALQSSGNAPLDVTGLRGVLSDSQPAAALRYDSAPTGLILQNLKDAQFVLVANGAGYDLNTVIKGNPNTLFKLISGAAGGNMMTTDTNQTPGAAVVKTWTAAQIFGGGLSITGGQINSSSQFGCRAGPPTAVQSINSGAFTAITFDQENFDRGPCHDNATNNARITVPTGGAGIWWFGGNIRWAPNAVGVRCARLRGNGTLVLAENRTINAGGVVNDIESVSTIISVADGDYVELMGFQDSGGALNTALLDGLPWFAGMKLC